MKVKDIVNRLPEPVKKIVSDARKASELKEAGFKSQLENIEEKNFNENLKELVGRIFKQGEKLAKRTDISDLKVYKKLVAEFLETVTSKSHKFSKRSFLDKKGRHKIFALVKRVNDELDLLAKDVLNIEKDHLTILKRLEDIRGLILDIAA